MSQAIIEPLSMDNLSLAQLEVELQKGIDDIAAGRSRPANDVFADMNRAYDIWQIGLYKFQEIWKTLERMKYLNSIH